MSKNKKSSKKGGKKDKKDKLLSSKKAQQEKTLEKNLCKNSETILTAFKNADTDYDFVLHFDDFINALESLGIDEIDYDLAKKIYKLLDITGEDGLELEDFVYGIHMYSPEISKKEIWKPVYLSKGKWKSPQYVGDFMGFDEAISIVQDINEDYKRQTMAFRSILDVVCGVNTNDIDGGKFAKKLISIQKMEKNPLIRAGIKSKKPMIKIETLFLMAAIAKKRRRAVTTLSPTMLKLCWEVLDNNEFGLAKHVTYCMQAICKWIPDDGNKSQLKMLLQGCTMEDFENVISSSIQCLKVKIKNASNSKGPTDKDFFVKVKEIIKEKIDPKKKDYIRNLGFELLESLEKNNDTQALRVTSTFDKSMINDYKKYKGEEIEDEKDNNDDNNNDNNEDEWKKESDYTGYIPKDSKDLLRERKFSLYDFKDYKKELQEMFDEFDIFDNEELRGVISAERATQYLRIVDITGNQSTMAIKALDTKFDGLIKRNIIVNYVLRKAQKIKKNNYLDAKAKEMGWTKTRESRLKDRKELYEKLSELEKKEFNYAGLNDVDLRLDIINYLLKK